MLFVILSHACQNVRCTLSKIILEHFSRDLSERTKFFSTLGVLLSTYFICILAWLSKVIVLIQNKSGVIVLVFKLYNSRKGEKRETAERPNTETGLLKFR